MSMPEFQGIYLRAIEIRRALGERWREEGTLTQSYPVIRLPDGRSFGRIRYGDEAKVNPQRGSSLARCDDCGVPRGAFHWRGCDHEVCPCCCEQLICCEWRECPLGLYGDYVALSSES